MSAGWSAERESQRQAQLAQSHHEAATAARQSAGRYAAAVVSERATVAALDRLAGVGYHLLADRRWPGSRRANVDLVVVGPGGVFIVDTKWWADVTIRGGRIFRGQEDVSDDLSALEGLRQTVEADLVNAGLSPNEVHSLVVLYGRDSIDERVGGVRVVGERDALSVVAGHGQRHSAARVDELLARCLELFPPMEGSDIDLAVPLSTPVVVADPLPQEHSWDRALLTEEEIGTALLDSLMTRPVEEWMAFLHPSQAKVVRRSFNGPSRIRGSAGTGKTVVGLHRAAYLARADPEARVLVTTYVATLPSVLSQSLRQLAPDVVDRVAFTNVHKFANSVLAARGVPHQVQPRAVEDAFSAAWAQVGRSGLLGSMGLPRRYWEDEVMVVLRGRGVTDFATYADLSRTGRKFRLGVDQRRAVWDLYLAYCTNLRGAGVTDYAGTILRAEDALRSAPYGSVPSEQPITSIIVDEAQDLSCAQIRMLHQVVGDRPDGLTLIGDGQQSIYPGGYTLAEAGVSLAGRGVVMDVNYRNTAQIIEFAERLVDGDEFADIEGSVARADRRDEVFRNGAEPVVWTGNRSALGRAVYERVRDLMQIVGTELSDVGVLSPTLAGVQDVREYLGRHGVETVDLKDYDGRPSGAVKVGTIKRAKGLEFKQVLVVGVAAGLISATARPPAADDDRERWDRDRRELFVAMTRARDGLWVAITR